MSADTPAIVDVDIPKRVGGGRPPAPNPYRDIVAALCAEGVPSVKAKAVKVATDDAVRTTRLIQRAAPEGATIRVNTSDTDSKGLVTVTFWAIEQIVRKSKDEGEAHSTAA